jgi:hypothetical protein
MQNLTKNFNYASQRKASVPTLPTWLQSLCLVEIAGKLEDFGVVELMDLEDLSEKQFKELKLTSLQVRPRGYRAKHIIGCFQSSCSISLKKAYEGGVKAPQQKYAQNK